METFESNLSVSPAGNGAGAEVPQDRPPRPAAAEPARGAPPRAVASSELPRLAYSIAEASVMLGVCEKTIRRLIDRGLIRPSRALRHLLIPKKEIERFLDDTSD